MARFRTQKTNSASVPTPPSGWGTIFLDATDNVLKIKKDSGVTNILEINEENVADLIANIIDAGTGISVNYNDAGDVYTISVDFTYLNTIYYTESEINAFLSGKENVGIAAGLVTAHEAALDPHPQYLTTSEGNSAYAPLSHVGAGGSQHPAATLSVNGFMSASDKQNLDKLSVIPDLIKEPTGFENTTDSELSFDNGTRTFEIKPTGSDFTVYLHGNPIVVSSTLSLVVPNLAQNNFIFIDSLGTLQSFSSFSIDLLRDYVYVANIYWSPTLSESLGIADERHGLTMDWATHEYLHTYFGARVRNDHFTFGNFVLNGGGLSDTEVAGSIENGILSDEDLKHTITHNASPTLPFQQVLSATAELPVLYKDGAAGEWIKDTATNFLVKTGTSRIKWNQFSAGVWSTPDAGENEFVAMWIMATNHQSEPIRLVLGQNTSTTLNDAINVNTYESINFSGLPTQEFKILYRLIFQTSSVFANTSKASLVQVLDLRKTIDQGSVVSSVTDHGNLSGLSDDDHTQYHNNSRGDARYYTKVQLDAGQLDSRYYTETEVNTFLSGKENTGVAAGLITAHEAALDPHPQYTTTAEVNALIPVTSVFTRTGSVTAQSGDYNASQITNTPAGGISSTNIQAAINELDTEKSNVGHTHTSSDITDFNEASQDAVNNAFSSGSQDGVTVTYNDGLNSLSITNTDKGSTAVTTHEAALDPHPQYSLGSFTMQCGRDANATNIWLFGAGIVPMNESPFVLPANCTLVAISAATNGNETWDAEVYINGFVRAGGVPLDANKIAELQLAAVQTGFTTVSVNLNAGDEVGVFMRGTTINRPTVTLFFERR